MPTQDGTASVSPDQPWTRDGTADVSPLSPFPDLTPRTLPLKNRPATEFAVNRGAYPQGLVVIPRGNEPSTTPADLPIKASSGDYVTVTDEWYVDWPDGFVIWFTAE